MARATVTYPNNNNTKKNFFDFDNITPNNVRNGFQKNGFMKATKRDSSSVFNFIFYLVSILGISSLLYIIFIKDGFKMQFQLPPFYGKLLRAVVYGVGTSVFAFMITYLDSKEPGINPPTPLSPRRGKKYINSSPEIYFHFNYILALLIGVITFGITLMD